VVIGMSLATTLLAPPVLKILMPKKNLSDGTAPHEAV